MRALRGAIWLAAVLSAASGTLPATGADPYATRPRVVRDEEPADCLQATPKYIGVPGSSASVTLRLLVLVDGMAEGQATKELSKVAVPYEKLGISLDVRFRAVTMESDGQRPFPVGNETKTINAHRLIAAAKALFPEHRRPKDADLVYVVTSKDIWTGEENAGEDGRDYSPTGLADCTGGVMYASRAFAVGEIGTPFQDNGIWLSPDYSSQTAAHEIGHLMGAQHHYAVCGLSAANLAQSRADVCSLMFPDGSVATLEFSPTNAAIVTGTAGEIRRNAEHPSS